MYRPMARQTALAGKGIGTDQHGKMAFPRAVVPGMSGMTVAFVHHFQPDRRKSFK